MRLQHLSTTCLVLLSLTACSSLPSAGPTTSQIIDQAAAATNGAYELVEIDAHVAALSARPSASGFRAAFSRFGKPASSRISVGDAVIVTIWQASLSGLVGSTSNPGVVNGGGTTASSTTPGQIILPEQLIGPDGAISVPFAGRLRAAGLTPFDLQRSIERALSERLVEPQAFVAVSRSSATATVSGETMAGARVALAPRGDRLMDVIAAAGGVKSAPYEIQISVTRNGVIASSPMSQLISDPDENVYVWPGDTITLLRTPRTFTVFGATQNNAEVPFNSENLSLAQAIARAGGLQDSRADPSGVFLFRFEPPAVASALDPMRPREANAGPVPVLYHLNLQQAGGYFLASRFGMNSNDIIYVAGASTNGLQKFFTLIATISSPVISGAVLSK